MNYSIRLDRYPEQLPRAGSSTDEPQPMYRVSNMVNVTIRDLDSVGDVLDAVIEAGANDIWGITFAIDDPSEAQDEARAGAIEDALARAGALAELNGVELGPVMSVTEVIGSTPIPMPVALEKRCRWWRPDQPWRTGDRISGTGDLLYRALAKTDNLGLQVEAKKETWL